MGLFAVGADLRPLGPLGPAHAVEDMCRWFESLPEGDYPLLHALERDCHTDQAAACRAELLDALSRHDPGPGVGVSAMMLAEALSGLSDDYLSFHDGVNGPELPENPEWYEPSPPEDEEDGEAPESARKRGRKAGGKPTAKGQARKRPAGKTPKTRGKGQPPGRAPRKPSGKRDGR